jgi:hypothetical protein
MWRFADDCNAISRKNYPSMADYIQSNFSLLTRYNRPISPDNMSTEDRLNQMRGYKA